MNLAPIILFVYNRPSFTLQTLESLHRNQLADESILIIYADGPKANANEADITKINEVKQVIQNKQWCKEVRIIERTENLGLARSVITGVTEVLEEFTNVIVLEDDLITSPFFLQYMNDALRLYEKEDSVISIGACNFFAVGDLIPNTFFVPIPDCWGWATWRDRWQLFEQDSNKLLKQLYAKNLIDKFNLYGAYSFEGMLKEQAEGKISSWAIRWQAVAYINNKLSLYPKYSLTLHVGIDDATHATTVDHSQRVTLALQPVKIHKQNITTDAEVIRQMNLSHGKLFHGERYQPTTIGRDSAKNIRLKKLIKLLIPPIFPFLKAKMSKKGINISQVEKKNPVQNEDLLDADKEFLGWRGNYTSWSDAIIASKGYDAPQILERVKEAVLKVKNGEAVYERDSVIFDKIEYSWPVLAILLRIASEQGNTLEVIDFGGALGSSYFQNRSFFNALNRLQWRVVEQTHFVTCGNQFIADEHLSFYESIDTALKNLYKPIFFASGVIQYLPDPSQWIRQIVSYNFEYIIIDRTSFVAADQDQLTIQYVPESIYSASYPSWFFNYDKFIYLFEKEYELITSFDNGFTPPIFLEDGKKAWWQGLILKKKPS